MMMKRCGSVAAMAWKAPAHLTVKREVRTFERILDAREARARTLQPQFGADIEQEGEIRHEAIRAQRDHLFEDRVGHLPALVGTGGIGETVAQHHMSASSAGRITRTTWSPRAAAKAAPA